MVVLMWRISVNDVNSFIHDVSSYKHTYIHTSLITHFLFSFRGVGICILYYKWRRYLYARDINSNTVCMSVWLKRIDAQNVYITHYVNLHQLGVMSSSWPVYRKTFPTPSSQLTPTQSDHEMQDTKHTHTPSPLPYPGPVCLQSRSRVLHWVNKDEPLGRVM